MFGNPNALTRCTAADYALQECPVNSQAGLITIRANYEGDEEFLLGTAPIFDMVPQANETARFSLIVPTLGIPIAIPVAVRTGGDYGLRFSVAEITQLIPLRSAKLTIWGMPGLDTHNSQRFQKGSPGEPGGLPRAEDTTCGGTNAKVSITVRPLINYPTTCSNQPLHTELDVQSYQDPSQLSHADSEYPPVTGCEQETFNPVLGASLTTDRDGCRLGAEPQLQGSPDARLHPVALAGEVGDRQPAAGADDQPGRRRRADRLQRLAGELPQRGPRRMPRQRQDRHDLPRHSGARRAADRLHLHRRTEARGPVPPVHDPQRIRHQREADRVGPARPGDRPADRTLRRPAAGARSTTSTSISSPPTAA